MSTVDTDQLHAGFCYGFFYFCCSLRLCRLPRSGCCIFTVIRPNTPLQRYCHETVCLQYVQLFIRVVLIFSSLNPYSSLVSIKSQFFKKQRPNCMPCYRPCCTQCHSRMGTGEFGPCHVFRHDQFKHWPTIRSMCHSGAADWKASFTPQMSSPCSGVNWLLLLECAWDQARHREIRLFKRLHRQWTLIDQDDYLLIMMISSGDYVSSQPANTRDLIDWLIERAGFNVSTNTV